MPAPLPTQTFPREATVAIIKPDAAASADAILAEAVGDGFLLLAKTSATLTKAQALELYAGTDGADAAAEHLSSGEVVVALLEKSFGIEGWLKLCGPDDAAVARDTAPQTLRARFGSDAVKNGVHGSGSVAAAAREAAFFFGGAATALESPFALIKPETFGSSDAVLAAVEASGFSVLCSEQISIGADKAADFGCGAEGAALAMVLTRPCAVTAWLSLCGPADPAKARAAAPFSISAQYGACHASESAEAAANESAAFFPFLGETQTTLALVCPHAVAAGAVEPIVAAAAAAGLVITERRVASLDEGKAQDFLDLLGAAAPPKAPPAPAPEPFISAWVEGGKCNKALQLYNPSDAVVDLANYALPLLRGKGKGSAADTTPTSLNPFPAGKCIPPYGVFVVYHPEASAAIKAELPVDARASMPSTELSNGDDGCCLVKLGAPAAEPEPGAAMPPFTVLDCVGDFTMANKGRPWPVAGKPSSSKNNTLVRKPTVAGGNPAAWNDPTASSQGTSEATSEWVVLKKDTLVAEGWSLTSWADAAAAAAAARRQLRGDGRRAELRSGRGARALGQGGRREVERRARPAAAAARQGALPDVRARPVRRRRDPLRRARLGDGGRRLQGAQVLLPEGARRPAAQLQAGQGLRGRDADADADGRPDGALQGQARRARRVARAVADGQQPKHQGLSPSLRGRSTTAPPAPRDAGVVQGDDAAHAELHLTCVRP